jgi:hypothetical protein
MSRKSFTVDEADAMIPSLIEAFREIDAHRRAIREFAGKIEVLELIWGSALRDPDHPDHADFSTHREGIDRCTRGIETAVERGIWARGVLLPQGGLEEGLVDFPSTYQGRWVCLCWKLGERHVAYWHEPDAGFRGRQKITDVQRRVMGTDDPDSIEDPGVDFDPESDA